MFKIPVQDLNDQTVGLSLSGANYTLRLMWNGTCSFWTADLSDSALNPIVTGLAVRPDYPLFDMCKAEGLPAGNIICIVPDRRDTLDYVTLVNGSAGLYYVEPDDLDDLT